jgi:hypothetical protein
MSRYSNEQGDHKMPWYESVKPLWRTAPDRLPALLFIFNTFFGWLLTTLFAAGASGFLRRGQGLL